MMAETCNKQLTYTTLSTFLAHLILDLNILIIFDEEYTL
jgi:hypothetical protein